MFNLYQIIAFSVTTLFTLCAVFCYKTKPNIIIITADDMGWNDVSYHGSDQIPTPNIDALAYNGVILNKHYVQPVCTPSRAALMTGKYPIHTGMQGIPILNTEIRGLPLSEELLPQYLQQLGYSTHLIGKWHLGHYNKRYTPLQRGFNSHLGFLTGYIGYYSHVCCCVLFPEWCGHDMKRNYSTAWDLVGRYATDVFTEEAVFLITSHEGNKPLFLMISHVAPHAGNEGNKLEAPQEEINKFQYIINPNRRTYAAMVSKLDQSVGEVIAALQRKNLLENSIIIFLSDNGAANHQFMENWGSNYPLRGEKGTLWEGGIRVPALIWSPLIQANSRIADHLMHISDWLPTLLTAAGGHHLIKNKKLDGVDQWETIINKQVSPRKEVLINIDELNDLNALIYGKFKYIYGTRNIKITSDIKFDHFSNIGVVVDGEKSPEYNISSIIASETWKAINTLSRNINKEVLQNIPLLRIDSNIQCHHQIKLPNCRIKKCLFNLDLDPCEQFNLADKYPMLLKFLELIVKTYKLLLVPQELLKTDQRSNPKYFNYTWNSWI